MPRFEPELLRPQPCVTIELHTSLTFQLMFEPQFNRVEKIKIISSTLMAACGLVPGRYYTLNPYLFRVPL